MEKKEVFSQFKEKVSEITQHYEEIEEMKFDAKLKNGTRFSFTFDSDKFSRKTGEADRKKHHPVSVFNAVVDILKSYFTYGVDSTSFIWCFTAYIIAGIAVHHTVAAFAFEQYCAIGTDGSVVKSAVKTAA